MRGCVVTECSEISHIQGSKNVVADALSRLQWSDIKQMGEISKEILVVTRSMAEKNDRIRNEDKLSEAKAEDVPIYEEFAIYDKKSPRLRCAVEKGKLKVMAYKSHKKVFEFEVILNANERSYPLTFISMLEKAAFKHHLSVVQLPLDDVLF